MAVRLAPILFVALLLAGCFVGDDGDQFLVRNNCETPVSVDLQELATDLDESDRQTLIEPGATDFVVMTTANPKSVFVEALNEESQNRIEFEVLAAQFLESRPGEYIVTLESERCP